MKTIILNRLSAYSALYLITLIFFLGACKEITDDLNVSPNSPTEAPADLVLNGAQVGAILVYEGNLARIGNIFSNGFTGSDRQYVLFNTYQTVATDYDDTWDNLYQAVISQAIIVENNALAVNNRVLAGIAQVMQAQGFGLAADLWGDVPFSEVGDAAAFPQPRFEPQADVYAGVQTMLSEAIVNLESGVGQSAWNNSKDLFYGGDAAKWAAAAHTLKARFFLHTKDYASAIAEAQQGIQSADGNMMAIHGNSFGANFNVYYDFTVYNRPAYLTADGSYLAGLLDPTSATYRGNAKTNETARFNYLFQPDVYIGGLELNPLSADFDGSSADNTGFFGSDSPFPLVTYEENILTLAEAQMKSGDAAGALASLNAYRAYLNAGGYIRPGYRAQGLLYEPYVAGDFANNDELLREILEERYVTFCGQIEMFNDIRRTKNFLGVTPKVGTQIPQRYFYSQNEINSNVNTPVLTTGDLFVPTPVNTSAY